MPRTGTASTKIALSILLNGPVYHMYEVFVRDLKDSNFWKEASQKEKSLEEWKKFFAGRGFRAAVDYPASLFYK